MQKKSTKVTDSMVCPMKVTAFHKHSTSNIVIKSRKTFYAINASVKMHKQISMAMNNTLLTRGRTQICKEFFILRIKIKIALSIVLTRQTQCTRLT